MFHPRHRMLTVRLALGWLVVVHSILAGAHWHQPTSGSTATAEITAAAGGPSCGCHHGSTDADQIDSRQLVQSVTTGQHDSSGDRHQSPDNRHGERCPDSDDCALCRAALQSAEISPSVVAHTTWLVIGRLDGAPAAEPTCVAPYSYQGRAPPLS